MNVYAPVQGIDPSIHPSIRTYIHKNYLTVYYVLGTEDAEETKTVIKVPVLKELMD